MKKASIIKDTNKKNDFQSKAVFLYFAFLQRLI